MTIMMARREALSGRRRSCPPPLTAQYPAFLLVVAAAQMPYSWCVPSAKVRQHCRTWQLAHTALARWASVMAMPALPIGKKSSGSRTRQAADSRQESRSSPAAVTGRGRC